jgi:hypothetical protein
VSGLITSRPAISALLRPCATRRRISLPVGELGEPGGLFGRIAAGGELGDQAACDPRRDQRVAGGDDLDRVQQFAWTGVLEQEAAGARSQRAVDVLVGVERGEHEDACALEVPVGADEPRRLQPVEHGHADVHQHDVREHSPGEVHRFAAVRRLAGELHPLLRVDEGGEAAADGGLVIGDEDADHAPLA